MNTTEIVLLLVSSIVGYLLGSINFAIMITKIFSKTDIRNCGSGNAGFTNVLRTQGKVPAILTLLGDLFKGIISVLLARLLFFVFTGEICEYYIDYIVACFAMLGHLYPVYYGFKGGKGILVSFGAMLILSPQVALICLSVFLITLYFSKYVSLGSILSASTFTIATALITPINLTKVLLTLPIVVPILIMHRENIVRLCKGTERKISMKK